MLRIASLAILAITVPTYAQSRRAGPGNLDQKLNQILERLERLEQRVEAKEEHRADDAQKARVENLFRFLRGFDGDRRHEARRRRPQRQHDRRDGPRGRPDMQRGPRGPRGGPDMRGRAGKGGPQGRPEMGNQPFGKLPEIIQAARRGDPRATQMLTRVRKAIDDALRSGHGPKGKPARRAKSAAPPIQTGFRLVKPTAKLDVVELGAAGTLYRSNAQAMKKAEIARRKAEVYKAHDDMIRREKMAKAHQIELDKKAKAHYQKLQRGEKAMRKKVQKDEYARIKKLMAESERLQEEIRRLRAELGAKRR